MSCKEAIEKYLKHGSGIKINGESIFNYGKHCSDYNNFKRVFKENFEDKYEHSKGDSETASSICGFVGDILIGTGKMLKGIGGFTQDSVVIRKR